jgi:PiT family inorganic phosphate transporter
VDISLLVAVVIVTALAFDFTNGFHDTANAMATSIATGALKPKIAVAISATLNLLGAFLSVKVASTISSGLVDETKIGPAVIFGGLIGAIVWNLVTWFFGLPSSSSHALFGGLIGATWVAAGGNAIHFATIVSKVLIPAVASPIIAGIVAFAATKVIYLATSRSSDKSVQKSFKFGQTVTASLVSLAHGTNDAQKTMGIITLTLITSGTLKAHSNPPLWVIASCAVAIAAGTFLGGWRIIHTMGTRITDVSVRQGFAAEASSAATILASGHLGFALSTTHVCTGGVIGSGLGKDVKAVRWNTAGRMAIAWLLTLPAAGVMGAAAASLAKTGNVGVIAVAAVAIVIAAGLFVASRQNPITADNVVDLPAPRSEDVPVPVAA